MRYWGVASVLVFALTQPAGAQPVDVAASAEADAPRQPLGYAAMPGGMRAPSAETLPGGAFGLSAIGGYGFRNTLLSEDHKMTRSIGDLAFAYAPTDMITIALSFDGRYDKHDGLSTCDADNKCDGYVGDPHLLARLGKSLGSVRVGGQLGIWVPGKDAPSVATSAISIEARGLVSVKAGPGTLSFSGGFRLDNSAESVEDVTKLGAEDRVSLGVSDFHAVVGGVHLAVPAGRAFFGVEASTDLFVGSGAPGPIIRGGASGGVNLSEQWSAFLFVQAARVPGLDEADVMAGDITIIPYEPIFTGGVGLAARFGGPSRKAGPPGDDPFKPRPPEQIEVIEYAEISGSVTDDTGKPVAGGKVTIKLKDKVGTTVTDEKGTYTSKVSIGKTVGGKTTLDDTGAEVTVAVDGKKPKSTTITLVKGSNVIPVFTLDPVLPPGQLKAVIRTAGGGKPIANAVVKVEPGGHTGTSDADGNLSIDLPPGTYKATCTANGFKDQTLDVVIDKDGVVVKNFELRK